VGRMSENLVTDPMKVYYRANSLRSIKKLAQKNSFSIEKLILNGDPTYLAINRRFFYLGIGIEKLLSLPLLLKTRVHIIGVLRKT